jgi:hypothetical protein
VLRSMPGMVAPRGADYSDSLQNAHRPDFPRPRIDVLEQVTVNGEVVAQPAAGIGSRDRGEVISASNCAPAGDDVGNPGRLRRMAA